MVIVSDEKRKNYAARIEKLLIVSWNTIRLTDYPIAKFVDEQLGEVTPDDAIKLSILNRSTAHMRYRGLSRDAYYKSINLLYPEAYVNAPLTLIHSILYSVAFKSVQDIVVAHNTFMDTISIDGMYESHVLNVPFNGTIEDLERLIIEYGSTGIVVDDIEYVKELIERGNISIEGMTFIVSMIGYNFEKTEEGTVYKYRDIIETAMETLEFDIAFADLFILSKENLENYVGGQK